MKYTIFIAIPFLLLMSRCQSRSLDYEKIRGQTMGTYYAMTCEHNQEHLQKSIDSILIQFNKELSTYDPESLISIFNQSSDGIQYSAQEKLFATFLETLKVSKLIHSQSEKKFDPSLMPVINYWGFGYEGREVVNGIDSMKIDSLMQNVGLDKIIIDTDKKKIKKLNPHIELDFSAIAKGYAVDIICQYLDDQYIQNYLVDIGGESKAKGFNQAGKIWTVGINTPSEDAALTDIFSIVRLQSKALATSGNYRNFLTNEEGLKYGHTIDSSDGFPAKTDILSVSVLADKCILADAWATSFMALGLEKSKQKIIQLADIEALFIYGNNTGQMSTWHSPGFTQYLLQN